MRITGGNQTHGHCVDPRKEMQKGGARGVGWGANEMRIGRRSGHVHGIKKRRMLGSVRGKA